MIEQRYEEERHAIMLEQLWDVLMPNQPRDSRFTKQWIDIGFQGADPVTDLRGSGLLGLKQLHSFCLQSKTTALPIFKNSTCPDTFHFFCVTGINITQKLVNSLRGETNSKTALATDELINLDKHLLEHVDRLKTDADYVKVMGFLYKQCFIEFDKAWC